MKTSLSFIDHPGRWVPFAATALWCAAAVLLVLAFWAIAAATAARGELPGLRERLARSGPQIQSFRGTKNAAVALPPEASLVSLRRRVASLNTLLGHTGQPLLHDLALFERLLPTGARLVSLHQVTETGVVTLVAESETQEALTRFLQSLEGCGQFTEVLLVRQSQPGDRVGSLRQFELRLKERV
jgi:hypothetical protein